MTWLHTYGTIQANWPLDKTLRAGGEDLNKCVPHVLCKAALPHRYSVPIVHGNGVALKKKVGKENRPDVTNCQACQALCGLREITAEWSTGRMM